MTQALLRRSRFLAGGVSALCLALSGCGGIPGNRLLTPVHQPVVTHRTYGLDLITTANGLSAGEVQRLDGWFAAMNLRYGDHVAIDDPLQSEGTSAAIAALVGRYGLHLDRAIMLSDGSVGAGTARVVITRAQASVPGCPDWSSNAENNFHSATSSNFGCAVNGNLAAMVADPDHLLAGARGGSTTVVMSSNKAIDAYRAAKPSGEGGTSVKKVATQTGGN